MFINQQNAIANFEPFKCIELQVIYKCFDKSFINKPTFFNIVLWLIKKTYHMGTTWFYRFACTMVAQAHISSMTRLQTKTSNLKSGNVWKLGKGQQTFILREESCGCNWVRGWSENCHFQGRAVPFSRVNFLGNWYPSAYYGNGKCNLMMEGGGSLRWSGEGTFIYRGCPVRGGGSPLHGRRINKIGLQRWGLFPQALPLPQHYGKP